MNDAMSEGSRDTFSAFQRNTQDYTSDITAIRKHSSELTLEDIGGPLDLAFIDGDHSEEGVRADFVKVQKFVKEGGIIALHDVRDGFPGVHVVLGEALASGDWKLLDLTDSLASIVRVR
jgi:hypothetical protein